MILFIIVVVGVVLYFISSGLLNQGAQGLSALFPPLTSSSSAFTSTPPGFRAPLGPSSPAPTTSAPTTIGPVPPATTIGNPSINPAYIPAGFTAAQLSPYFHEIQFGSVYSGYGGANGVITLYAYQNNNETIDVSGWQIRANRGSEYVPQAVTLYDPSGFAPEGDIRLEDGDILYLYSSPGVINLRLNKCIGYLQEDLNTNPALPLTCPSANQAEISSFTGACQNYILSLPACTVPDANSPQVPQNDYACQQYLSTINYKGCFEKHESDPNFFSNQWWAWTGSNILDPSHDIVDLFDRNGLLVDQYTY